LGRIYQNQSFLYNTSRNDTRAKASLDSAILFYQKSGNPKARKSEATAYSDLANRLKIRMSFNQL